MEKKHKSNSQKLVKNMKTLLIRLLFFSIITNYIFKIDNTKAYVPYYYLPSKKILERESLSIGKTAYQLLYFGQIIDSLNLAKLAISINKSSETLWTILADAQIANKLYNEALISLNSAQKINPEMSEIYFAKSSIYLKQSKIKKAKFALQEGIKIVPTNVKALFQLGNIFLMEKNYKKAINEFEKAIKIKPDFWQAFNNIGLAYYELDKINLSIKYFKKAITLEENAEPLLALASSLQAEKINESIILTKKALIKEPNYVEYEYRKEQLWGEKLQNSTKKLFQNSELTETILLAKRKLNTTY